jgi:hypothetical protein
LDEKRYENWRYSGRQLAAAAPTLHSCKLGKIEKSGRSVKIKNVSSLPSYPVVLSCVASVTSWMSMLPSYPLLSGIARGNI